MTRPAAKRFLGHDFDAFLFEPVFGRQRNDGADDEKSGALSVLSALARLEMDPWSEAAALAGMPRHAATHRLASLIAALPARALGTATPSDIAERLLLLLPRADPAIGAPRAALAGAAGGVATRSVATMILLNLFIMFAMICAQWTIASLQAAKPGSHVAAVPGLVVPGADGFTGPRDGRPARAFPAAQPAPSAP